MLNGFLEIGTQPVLLLVKLLPAVSHKEYYLLQVLDLPKFQKLKD
jgi:hypothetical protein